MSRAFEKTAFETTAFEMGPASISFVAGSFADSGVVTTDAVPVTTPVAAFVNDLIIIAARCGDKTVTPSISDTNGNTWTGPISDLQIADGTGASRRVDIWYTKAAVAGLTTVTVTYTGANALGVSQSAHVSIFRGAENTVPVDASAAADSAAGTGAASSVSLTPNGNLELVFMAGTTNPAYSTATPTTGYNVLGSNTRLATAYKIQGAKANDSPGWTWNTAIEWAEVAIAFRPSLFKLGPATSVNQSGQSASLTVTSGGGSVALQSVAVQQSGQTAALRVAWSLKSSVADISSQTAALRVSWSLKSSVANQSGQSALLRVVRGLQALATQLSGQTASARVAWSLKSTCVAQSGNVNEVLTVAGNGAVALQASSSCTSSQTAALRLAQRLQTAASCTSSQTANLGVLRGLKSTAINASSQTAALRLAQRLQSSSISQSGQIASARVAWSLKASAIEQSGQSANLHIILLAFPVVKLPSVREQIILSVIAALEASGTGPYPVFRSKADPLVDLPAYCVYPLMEECSPEGRTIVAKNFTVAVECVVAGPSPAAEYLDPLLKYAVQVIYASDRLRAFLVKDIDETRIRFNNETKDKDLATASLEFTLSYFQTRGKPYEYRTQ
jgi:hypothetical protein